MCHRKFIFWGTSLIIFSATFEIQYIFYSTISTFYFVLRNYLFLVKLWTLLIELSFSVFLKCLQIFQHLPFSVFFCDSTHLVFLLFPAALLELTRSTLIGLRVIIQVFLFCLLKFIFIFIELACSLHISLRNLIHLILILVISTSVSAAIH